MRERKQSKIRAILSDFRGLKDIFAIRGASVKQGIKCIKDKDGTIKDKDEEIEALNIRIEMCPIVINLDAQHGDLDEEGGSFTRPKRHRRDLFSTTAELQALMDE